MPAKRLSTAFDSVTLYGEDPDRRPDIYGKVGNSGVSIATVDDAKKLYSGFDLADPKTSVSMTINGPAPMLLAFFHERRDRSAVRACISERERPRDEVTRRRSTAHLRRTRAERPHYQGDCPRATTASGSMLLGVTGDQVLPAGGLRARSRPRP